MGALAQIDTAELRLNAICPYYTMFPLDFPLQALGSAQPNEWVLDPFCGRGTTLYAARLRGLRSVGIDSNPVAVAASAAKLVSARPDEIVGRARSLLASEGGTDVPTGSFWRLCFHQSVLRDLCVLRAALRDVTSSVDIALRAIVLGALHGPRNRGAATYLSNQMPRTYSTKPASAVRYWTKQAMRAPRLDTLEVLRRHAEWRYARVPASVPGRVCEGTAETVLPRLRQRFTWVVTSPPYPGMVTYRPDQWLRNWFLGGPPEVVYTRDDQLGGVSGEAFVERLARVWSLTARRCVPNASLLVRFGGLPSVGRNDPEVLLEQSLQLSGQWRVLSFQSAGGPANGRRQADQFGPTGQHVEEVDCLAVRRP